MGFAQSSRNSVSLPSSSGSFNVSKVGFGTLRGRLQCLQFCLYLFGGFNEIWSSLKSWKLLKEEFGGARRDRTADLDTASVALSQLSYSPTSATEMAGRRRS